MSRRVPDSTLDAMHLRLSGMFRHKSGSRWLEYDSPGRGYEALVEVHDLICLLDELRQRRKTVSRRGGTVFLMSPVTKALIAMAPGDVVTLIEPITQGQLTSMRGTARKYLNNLEAVWYSYPQPNGSLRIVRMPDGTPRNKPRHNPAVYTLADMAVGEVVVLRTLHGKMHTNVKVHARKTMGDSAADWRCENLASGNVRARRTR